MAIPKTFQKLLNDPRVADISYEPWEGYKEDGKQAGSIYWVYLTPEYRHQGTGTITGSTIAEVKEQMEDIEKRKVYAIMVSAPEGLSYWQEDGKFFTGTEEEAQEKAAAIQAVEDYENFCFPAEVIDKLYMVFYTDSEGCPQRVRDERGDTALYHKQVAEKVASQYSWGNVYAPDAREIENLIAGHAKLIEQVRELL